MALAKLCACTCGGAIIGSGAMKIADVPATAQVQTCCKKKVVRKRHAAKRPVKRVRRVVTTKRVIRTATPQTQVVTQTIRSEEHTSELQSLMRISYAVFCLKKKNKSRKKT